MHSTSAMFSPRAHPITKAPLIRDVGRLECVHFTGTNPSVVARRRVSETRAKTTRPRKKRRDAAWYNVWSRQSATSILGRVSFLFLPLPSLCLARILTSGCLRVFMLSFLSFYFSRGMKTLSVFRIYPCLSVPLREGHWDVAARRWRCPLEVFPSTIPKSLEGGQIFKLQKGPAMFSRFSSSSFERYLSFFSHATICWQIRKGFYLRTEYIAKN